MKKPSNQLALDLPLEPRFGREDFLVSPSNEAAWSMFERWPDWPGRMAPEGRWRAAPQAPSRQIHPRRAVKDPDHIPGDGDAAQ